MFIALKRNIFKKIIFSQLEIFTLYRFCVTLEAESFSYEGIIKGGHFMGKKLPEYGFRYKEPGVMDFYGSTYCSFLKKLSKICKTPL